MARARPRSPSALYFTYCLNCGRTLVRVPWRGPTGNTRMSHPTIAINDDGNIDVIGWQDHCPTKNDE